MSLGPRLELERGEGWVAGFPQWVILSFEHPDPQVGIPAVASVRPEQICPELALVAKHGEEIVAQRSPRWAEDVHGMATGPSIGPGQRRAGIFDLDAMLALPPGVYQLSVDYPATKSVVRARAVAEIELLAPTSAEAASLRDRPEGGWMTRVVDDGAAIPTGPEAPSPRVHEHLRLHARLQLAVRKRGLSPLEIDGMFAATPRELAAVGDLLRYELARLEGQSPGVDDREALSARWPGWRWWLDEADAGRGPLAMLRERRDILVG